MPDWDMAVQRRSKLPESLEISDMMDFPDTRHRSGASAFVTTVLIAALSFADKAIAGETKPVIAIATKAAEITVTIDDALKAYPPLYADLLAEGQREARRWRADAVKERRRPPVADGQAWTY